MNVDAVSRRFGAAALVIGPLGLVLGSLFQVYPAARCRSRPG
jgi:hypothetical protein